MIRNGLLKEAEEQILNVLSRFEMSICRLLESAQVKERENVLSRIEMSISLQLEMGGVIEKERMCSPH